MSFQSFFDLLSCFTQPARPALRLKRLKLQLKLWPTNWLAKRSLIQVWWSRKWRWLRKLRSYPKKSRPMKLAEKRICLILRIPKKKVQYLLFSLFCLSVSVSLDCSHQIGCLFLVTVDENVNPFAPAAGHPQVKRESPVPPHPNASPAAPQPNASPASDDPNAEIDQHLVQEVCTLLVTEGNHIWWTNHDRRLVREWASIGTNAADFLANNNTYRFHRLYEASGCAAANKINPYAYFDDV